MEEAFSMIEHVGRSGRKTCIVFNRKSRNCFGIVRSMVQVLCGLKSKVQMLWYKLVLQDYMVSSCQDFSQSSAKLQKKKSVMFLGALSGRTLPEPVWFAFNGVACGCIERVF